MQVPAPGSGTGSVPVASSDATTNTASALPSFAPIISLAQQLAQATQLPQIQAIRDAQATSDAQARASDATIAGYTKALANTLSQIAPATQQGYNQAAGMTALLGKGFGDQLGVSQQQNQDQANGILQLSGGQAQAPGINAVTNPNIGGALGFLNGGLPAQGIAQAGAAYGAAARALPAAFAGQGLQQIAATNAQQGLTDQNYLQKLANIEAQYPGVFLKTENQLATQQATQAKDAASIASDQSLVQYRQVESQINEQKLQAQIAKDQATAAYQKGELTAKQYADKINAYKAQVTALNDKANQAVRNYQAQTSRMNAVSSRERANAEVAKSAPGVFSSTTSRALGYRADQYGNPIGKKVTLLPGFGFGPNGDIVKTSTSQTSKTHGLTALEVNKYNGLATTIANNAFTGFTDSKGVVHPKLDFQEAELEMQKEGIPQWVYLPALNKVYPAQARPVSAANAAAFYQQTTPASPTQSASKTAAGNALAASFLKGK